MYMHVSNEIDVGKNNYIPFHIYEAEIFDTLILKC